jgi:hypothetical protein
MVRHLCSWVFSPSQKVGRHRNTGQSVMTHRLQESGSTTTTKATQNSSESCFTHRLLTFSHRSSLECTSRSLSSAQMGIIDTRCGRLLPISPIIPSRLTSLVSALAGAQSTLTPSAQLRCHIQFLWQMSQPSLAPRRRCLPAALGGPPLCCRCVRIAPTTRLEVWLHRCDKGMPQTPQLALALELTQC